MNDGKTPVPRLVRLLIVDDHHIVRDGLRVMLTLKRGPYEFIISDAETGEEAIRKVQNDHFDLVIMDYDLPGLNGVTSTIAIHGLKPKLPVLALSHYDELFTIDQMLAAGTKGYILKNIEATQLLLAVRTVLAGEYYLSSEAATKYLSAGRRLPSVKKSKDALTPKEKEILKLIAVGLSNDEMADKLHRSRRTIETHRANIMGKLGIHNTAALLRAAYENGLAVPAK